MNDIVSEHHRSKASNVLAGKTARACDSCLVKRARWFCAGDDAFLCQVCDNSVHSANPLASRHKRVRLETTSPSWHHGFTRKARTPRHAKGPSHLGVLSNQLVVPEMVSEDPENEEQLFCRVPVFEEFAEELLDLNQEIGIANIFEHDLNLEELFSKCEDVESLLGEFSKEVKDVNAWEKRREEMKTRSGMLLRLDYEAVVAAWATQGCPWMDGIRPQPANLDEFMVACMESGICDERGWGAKNAGREARVSRYREKRRTRLFSNKIRYEVRKLNADKRPRIKGRFVKSTTFSASSLPPYHLINK